MCLALALTGCERTTRPHAPLRPSTPAVIGVVASPNVPAANEALLRPPRLPKRILVCCDSITVGIGTPSYREQLTTMLRARGIEPVWIVAAVSSTTCSLWRGLLGDLIATNRPDIVLINCGTNDRLNSDADIPAFTEIHGGIINDARARGVKVGVSSVQYSRVDGRPELAWLVPSEFRVNTAIGFTAFAYGDVAYADIVAIPATIANNPDGIHPGVEGDALYAAAWLAAGAAKGWWPA